MIINKILESSGISFLLTWWTDSSIVVLSLEEVLVAHGTHAIVSWVAVETAASGAEQRPLVLVGLLGHVPPVEVKSGEIKAILTYHAISGLAAA